VKEKVKERYILCSISQFPKTSSW